MVKKKELKYNYIIIGSSFPYYDYGYKDIMNLDGVKYFSSFLEGLNSPFIRFLVRIFFSKRVNQFIKKPFTKFVYKRIYNAYFNEEKPVCIIFFADQYYEISYIDFLHKKYQNSKFVLYFQDLVANKLADLKYIDILKQKFDVIISYDKRDSQKYSLYYYPTPMSIVDVEKDEKIKESDIFFCGYAKNRYKIINEIYKKMTNIGLKCDFYLMNYPDNEERIFGIHYNEPLLSYKANIQHILSTKCVLEIMQEGAVGYTPRLWESIIYEKHLLTNNLSLFESDFYNSKNIHFIDELDNIKEWIKNAVYYSDIEKEKLSPVNLLFYIDSIID